MSKKFLVFMILFSLALSMTATQEVSALTNSSGQYTRTTTASFHPSKICGDRICHPGGSSSWSYAVLASQRQGAPKATGGYNGMVIMHQLFVNSLAKSSQENSAIPSSRTVSEMPNPIVNATSPIVNATSPIVNATGSK
ncbi:hypothetical protein [Candidatus Nitrosotalea bavarica]|uniref:hypothetical protein n=1 Tax=Candidatus Nitrosotalea bavarica TaxID=1903277 RepID=UPI000C715272|nr:hypothetical protein [Candidatus Nitrosotalea bavarica]